MVYNLRAMFGESSDQITIDKQVMPAISDFAKPESPDAQIVHMYGFDYEQQKWVPLPVDPKMYTR